MEHEIPFGKFQQGKRAYLFRFSTFPGIFQWDEPTNRFPFSIEPKFPKILTKWKEPKVYADFPKKNKRKKKKAVATS